MGEVKTNKLNCILLIDDDKATNFLNEMILGEADCAEKVTSVESGQDALDYLSESVNGTYPQPDLIFLDINMPGMNGWEFMEKYNVLPEGQKGHIVVVMLTTSLNPDDEIKAKSLGHVEGFERKPLDYDMVHRVLSKYFPGRFS